MIDYLEALLEEDEEEEIRPGGGRMTLVRKSRGSEREESAPEGETVIGEEALPFELPYTERWVEFVPEGEKETAFEESEEQIGTDWSEDVESLEGLNETRRGSVTALYEALRRAGRTAEAVSGGTRTVTAATEEERPVEKSFTLTELDRAVERDARRYDGGFTLY